MVAFVKNVSAAISRKAPWVGPVKNWGKKRGNARQHPYYKLLYSDFLYEHRCVQINWVSDTSKIISNKINDLNMVV